MKRTAKFLTFTAAAVLTAIACKEAEPASEDVISGAYPLLVTPYTENGALDTEVLVHEACFVDKEGASGIIWPTANEIEVLDSLGEYSSGLKALAEKYSEGGMKSRLTAVCCGRTQESAIERVTMWDKFAKETGIKAGILARLPDNVMTEEKMEDYFRKVAGITSLPVIIQTDNHHSPLPSVELLIRLAREFPDTYGYVKEESKKQYISDERMAGLQNGAPYIKTIMSGTGALGLLHQGPAYGSRGCVTQKPDCTRLLVKMCERAAASADASDPEFAEAFGKMLIVANMNQHFNQKEFFRGPHLVLLKELGVFKNTITRSFNPDGTIKIEEFKVDDQHLEYIRAIKAMIYGN